MSALSIDIEADRSARKLMQRYGEQTSAVVEDLLHAVPHENAELLKLLRRILQSVHQKRSWSH